MPKCGYIYLQANRPILSVAVCHLTNAPYIIFNVTVGLLA